MSTTSRAPESHSPERHEQAAIRLGAVSYLNTLPLIQGLSKLRDVSLTLDAPSRLIDRLLSGEVDLALASVIDAPRAPEPVALVPAGMIGCDGQTMTVRLFSRVPLASITHVHVDSDSHTSVALLRLVLARQFGVRPTLAEVDLVSHLPALHAGAEPWPEAMLVIGDKVVTQSPPASVYEHQLDLGQAWKEFTGLPFVYAVWMCRRSEMGSEVVRGAWARLDRQRRHNSTRLDWIVTSNAPARGWPLEAAHHYLSDLLRYNVSPEHRRGLATFYEMAAAEGLLPAASSVVWADGQPIGG